MLIDTELVAIFSEKFGIEPERVIYGQLPVATNYWIRYNEENKGVAVHPYLAFFRLHKFHEGFKKLDSIPIVDFDGTYKRVKRMPVYLDYTVEIIGDSIAAQNEYMKRYMFWCGEQDSFRFTDEGGIEHAFRMLPNDPEDNSDLELEEESGRVVRTTFTFTVEAHLLDRSTTSGYITEILQRIHLYSGAYSDGNNVLVDETVIEEE